MEGDEKIVSFELYCPICKHEKASEDFEQCKECLEHPVNIDSRRPVKWEPKQ